MVDGQALQQQKKLILPYLDRAQEIESTNPKVAYYCRLYAIEQALKLGPKNLDPKIKDLVKALTANLEKAKEKLNIDRSKDQEDCEMWAKLIFARADKRDRTGIRDHGTRGSFYSAWEFFNVASQFGKLSPEGEKLRKYAGWRAIVIQKALKAGHEPGPPPTVESSPLEPDDNTDLMNALDNLPVVTGGASTSSAADPPPPHAPIASTPLLPPPSPPLHASTAPGMSSLRDFTIGQPVLFCRDGTAHSSVEPGKILDVRPGREDGTSAMMYVVELKGRQVVVPGELLAPCVEAGDPTVYYPENGPPEIVEVEEVYASRWPPTYLINRPGYGLTTAEDDRMATAPLENALSDHNSGEDGVEEALTSTLEPEIETAFTATAPPLPSGPEAPFLSIQHDSGTSTGRAGPPPPIPSPMIDFPLSSPLNMPQQPKPAAPPPAPVPTPPIALPSPPPRPDALPVLASALPEAGYVPSVAATVEAQRLSKEAQSALQFEDVQTAIKRLTEALRQLTGRQHN